MSFSDWLRVTTFCDCEEWCVHAEVQRLAAQQHEALVELRRTILRHSPCMSTRTALQQRSKQLPPSRPVRS